MRYDAVFDERLVVTDAIKDLNLETEYLVRRVPLEKVTTQKYSRARLIP